MSETTSRITGKDRLFLLGIGILGIAYAHSSSEASSEASRANIAGIKIEAAAGNIVEDAIATQGNIGEPVVAFNDEGKTSVYDNQDKKAEPCFAAVVGPEGSISNLDPEDVISVLGIEPTTVMVSCPGQDPYTVQIG